MSRESISNPPQLSGEPLRIMLQLDVEDTAVQSAALKLGRTMGPPDDIEGQMSASGAANPQTAREAILGAALESGLRDLLPEATLRISSVAPSPEALQPDK
jgi:hypothetical protein